MISEQMRVIGEELRATRKPVFMTTESALALIAAPKSSGEVPEGLRRSFQVQSRDVLGSTVVSLSLPDRDPRAVVVYLHGGAFVNEIQERHWRLAAQLAEAGVRVEVALYPLVPNASHRDSYALLDALYAELLEVFTPDRVVLCGDSSGAGLAIGFAQTLIDDARPMPALIVAISPWLDVTMANPAGRALEDDDPWLGVAGLVTAGRGWADGIDPRDPRVSPLFGAVAGLAPIELITGTIDCLHPDALIFAEAVRVAGGEIQVTQVDGAYHDYPLLECPEADGAVAHIKLVLRALA